MSKTKTTAAVFVVLVVVIALIIGGWQLGWWLKENSVNRNTKINQDSYGRQVAIADSILDDVAEVQQAGLPDSQRAAIIAQICQNAVMLTGKVPIGNNAEAFIAKEC